MHLTTPTILREDYAKAVGYAVAACIAAARAGLAKRRRASPDERQRRKIVAIYLALDKTNRNWHNIWCLSRCEKHSM